MATATRQTPTPDAATLAALFADRGPILIEVRFPAMGTAPDWYLHETEAMFEQLLDRLGPGVEIHLHSVLDLADTREPIVVKR